MPERAPTPAAGAGPLAAERAWTAPEVAGRYARGRFANARAAGRDPRAVARLLARHLAPEGSAARVLDVPHGAGRLASALEASGARWVGLDRSAAMLGEARAAHARPLVLGSVERLPFADRSFDAVVCCRLLHHLDEERELPRALGELVRVARGLVVVSFWDAGSLHAWRRRVGLRRDAGSRRPIAKRRLEAAFRAAGAEVVDYAHGLRFVSMQSFAAARRLG